MKDKLPQIQEVEIPEGKELLEDVYELVFQPEDLHEANEGGKRPYLKGRLGLVDVATANKRLYPRNLMMREVSKLKEDMQGRGIYGELDHPGDGKTKLARVSHFVTDALIKEDGEISGVIEFIPGTKNGDQALAIAKAGGKLGVSSRGFGTTVTDNKGNDVVQEDYKLVTWDIVADPANAGAHPSFVVEHKENKGMDLETLKKEHPELIEEFHSEVMIEARNHAREALREEFSEKLQEEGQVIREEAKTLVREQLLEDPEVAGAISAMDVIKKAVAPFVVEEDEDSEVTGLKARIQELEKEIADQDELIGEARSETEEISDIAKELGYHLYLERFLKSSERADQVVEMLGDVNEFDTLDELKERVEEIHDALSEEDKVREQYEDRIARLEKKLVLAENQRNKALEIGRKFGLTAYVEHKVVNHPKAIALREYILESGAKSKGAVDKVVESFNRANPVSEEFKRIRKGLKDSGPRRLSEEDELVEDKKGKSGGSVMGVSMAELQQRAGINK